MCVQGRFCLQRKPRQANPQPFPYPLTGGLGLIKLLSKTRRDEFPSFHLPCHPFNSAEIHSFPFSYVKMEREELALRGACREGRGKERRRSRRCVGSPAKVQCPRHKQRSQTRGNGRWLEKGKHQDICWGSLAGTSSVVFLFVCFCTQPEEKCDVKKDKRISTHVSVYLCTLSEECLLLAPPLPVPFSSEWGGLEN